MLFHSLLAGLFAGLSSAPHCAAMCGPLCAASCSREPSRRSALSRYQIGRTLGYAFAGALAGGLGRGLAQTLHASAYGPRLLGVALAMALLVLAMSALRESRESTPGLVALKTKPQRSAFGALRGLAPKEPLVLGLLSAFLPCGALGAGLLLAAATRGRAEGAALMIGFAIASAPSVLAGGWLLHRLTRVRGNRWPRAFALALGLGALFVGLRPLYHATAPQHVAAGTSGQPRCH